MAQDRQRPARAGAFCARLHADARRQRGPAVKRPRRGRTWAALSGNGAGLVRERAIATTVQRLLERLYQIDRLADVDGFVRPAGAGQREALLVRDAGDGTLELALHLPVLHGHGPLDPLCQIIEGVSHFVYLADRARAEREATQLELELQAEVDKFIVLAASMPSLDERSSAVLRGRLFDGVTYAH